MFKQLMLLLDDVSSLPAYAIAIPSLMATSAAVFATVTTADVILFRADAY